MAAEPVEEAADPAREAEKAPPTVLHGTLTVEVPGGVPAECAASGSRHAD